MSIQRLPRGDAASRAELSTTSSELAAMPRPASQGGIQPDERQRHADGVVAGGPGQVLAHDAQRAPRLQRAPPARRRAGRPARRSRRCACASGTASPMAKDTSARASTGPSFMPSPDHRDAMAAVLQRAAHAPACPRACIAPAPRRCRRARPGAATRARRGRRTAAARAALRRCSARHGGGGIGAQRLVEVEAGEPALLVGQVNLRWRRHGQRRGTPQNAAEPSRSCARLPAALAATRRLDTPAPAVSCHVADAFQPRGSRPRAASARDSRMQRVPRPARPRAASASRGVGPGRQWLLHERELRSAVSVPVLSNTTVSIAAQRLQRLQAAHQHAAPRQRAGRRQRGRRRGQRQRAGAGDDQHRDGDAAARAPGPADHHHAAGAGAGEQHAQQERAGDAVGQLRQLRLLDATRAPSAATMPRSACLLADALDAHLHRRRQVVAAGDHARRRAARQRRATRR